MDSCRTSDLLLQNSSPTCINLEEEPRRSSHLKHGWCTNHASGGKWGKSNGILEVWQHFYIFLWKENYEGKKKNAIFLCHFLLEMQLKRERKPKVFWHTQGVCMKRTKLEREKKEGSRIAEDQSGVRMRSPTPRQHTCWWHPAPRWNRHIWNWTCPFPECRPSLSTGRPAERRESGHAAISGGRRTPTTWLRLWPARFLSGRAPVSSSRSCGPPPNRLTC